MRKVREEKEPDKRKSVERRQPEKSRETLFFPIFRGSGGSKSRLAKAAGAEASGWMRSKSAGGRGTKHMWKSKC